MHISLGTTEKSGVIVIYTSTILIYVFTQAILGSRVYALYGNQRLHLIGLTFLCCILPSIVSVLGLHFHGTNQHRLLITYNVLGFSTDLLFLLLVFAHAIRSRRQSHFGSKVPMRSPFFSSSFRAIVVSSMDLLSLVVSDSLKYYSYTLTMYIITFSVVGFRRVDAEICIGATRCDIAGRIGLGLNTLLLLLVGTLAPRLLLHVRKEFYNSTEFGQDISILEARRTTTWRVARRSEQGDSYDLSSALEGSLEEPGVESADCPQAPEDAANNLRSDILGGILEAPPRAS